MATVCPYAYYSRRPSDPYYLASHVVILAHNNLSGQPLHLLDNLNYLFSRTVCTLTEHLARFSFSIRNRSDIPVPHSSGMRPWSLIFSCAIRCAQTVILARIRTGSLHSSHSSYIPQFVPFCDSIWQRGVSTSFQRPVHSLSRVPHITSHIVSLHPILILLFSLFFHNRTFIVDSFSTLVVINDMLSCLDRH